MNKKDSISKGGRSGAESQPINREHLSGNKAPPFKGSPKTSAKHNVMTPSGIKHAAAQTGPMYGGGGRSTQ